MNQYTTLETVDYHIGLIVGDSITISEQKLISYEIIGIDVVEIDSLDSAYTFKTTMKLTSNDYFYIREIEEEKLKHIINSN